MDIFSKAKTIRARAVDYETSTEVDVDCDPAELQRLVEPQQTADDDEQIIGLIKVQRTAAMLKTEKPLKAVRNAKMCQVWENRRQAYPVLVLG